MPELVSILMPAFRAEATVHEAVASVLAQTHEDWELCLVSDDGRDYRALLAAQGISDERLRHLSTGAVGAGPNAARNVGLAAARGSFVAPLDADDFFYPERLERLLREVGRSGVVADNVDVVAADGTSLLYRPFEPADGCEELPLEGFLALSTPLVLVMARELLRHPWNPEVILGEDTLFNLRAIEAAGALWLERTPLHAYRVHEDSICHRPDAAERAERAYTFCLEQMPLTHLGFTTERFRSAVTGMLERKRALNRAYRAAAERSPTPLTFQEFIAAGGDHGA